jgi:metal-sulfur cluster biosynthetic enzyme
MIENSNPTVFVVSAGSGPRGVRELIGSVEECDSCAVNRDAFRAEEVFEHKRHLNDPEHPLTLEQLNVVSLDHVHVDDAASTCEVLFTPTIPHCSMATLIGLSIRVKLMRSMPARFKVVVKISPGSHSSEYAVNKQLNDKERVAAALENAHLLKVINQCIAHTDSLFRC